MSMISATRSLLGLGLAALALPALADTTLNEHYPLAAGGRLEVNNVAGRIQLRGWDRNEVALSGTLADGLRLDAQTSRDRVELKVVYPQGRGNSGSAQLELRVPKGIAIEVDGVSSTIDIADVDLARLDAQTVSGSVVAAGRAGEAALETVSGSIRSRLAAPRYRAETVSGSITANEGPSGQVMLETVSGSITAATGAVSQLHAETVSGRINATVSGLAPGGQINMETVSGSIGLQLPRQVSAHLHVNSFSGDIDSDAGTVERPRYGPGTSLQTTLGSGNGDISIESHSGSVKVTHGG